MRDHEASQSFCKREYVQHKPQIVLATDIDSFFPVFRKGLDRVLYIVVKVYASWNIWKFLDEYSGLSYNWASIHTLLQ